MGRQIHSEHPLLPPALPLFFLLSMMPHGTGHPWGQSVSAVLVLPLIGRATRGSEMSLAPCKHCSATAKHQCVITAIFIKYPKHSNIWASTKEIIPTMTIMHCYKPAPFILNVTYSMSGLLNWFYTCSQQKLTQIIPGWAEWILLCSEDAGMDVFINWLPDQEWMCL